MENEILEATAALVAALERGDAATAGEAYADGARLIAASGALLHGRAEIEAYWRTGIDLGLSGLAFESSALDAVEGGALELGRYAISVAGPLSPALVEHGSYLVLHARSRERSWQRAVEVFNPDEPTARHHHPKEEQ